ncbi:MAG TPA: YbgC/FadM family acyl-CoA thioesterase [Magnetospirillum sp.]|jgi:acyl-CoA thioester hydrolase|nr:YbgC/FadM family acyl-CoA thioesterase [Magnetospirillum sp.]
MTHLHTVRVYWEDTDAGGIVYHSNYLNFAERARTEMVRKAGLKQSDLAAEGYAFAVRHVAVDFLKSAKLDDLLEVESTPKAMGGASMEVGQVIRRLDDGAELVRLDVKLAFISLDGKPVRIPAQLRNSLQALVSERR